MDRPASWKARCRPWTLDPAWRPELDDMAAELGLGYLCSVFTLDAVLRAFKWLNAAWMDGTGQYPRSMIKVASSEIANQPLLQEIGARPPSLFLRERPSVWLSLGEVAHAHQVSTAIARLSRWDVTLLACVAEYPVREPLRLLDSLAFARTFGLPVGVSSHVAHPDCLRVARSAVKRGATVVEAHLRVEGVTPENAPDNGAWALWPGQFVELVAAVREAEGEAVAE